MTCRDARLPAASERLAIFASALVLVLALTPPAVAQLKYVYEWRCSQCKKVVATFDNPDQKPKADECIFCGTKFLSKTMMGFPGGGTPLTPMQQATVDFATSSSKGGQENQYNILVIIVVGLGLAAVVAVGQILRQFSEIKKGSSGDAYLYPPNQT